MRSRLHQFIALYTTLSALSASALSLLNEQKPDAYIALNILAYYTSYAITRPGVESWRVKAMNIALLVTFLIIISYRIYEVLAK